MYTWLYLSKRFYYNVILVIFFFFFFFENLLVILNIKLNWFQKIYIIKLGNIFLKKQLFYYMKRLKKKKTILFLSLSSHCRNLATINTYILVAT